MDKFWMLWDGNQTPTKRHATFEAAEAEAQRLITQKGLTALIILEAVAVVAPEAQPTVTTRLTLTD